MSKNKDDLRDILLSALRKHAQGHVEMYKADIEVYLRNPVGAGEHPDILDAMEAKLKKLAEYDDIIEMLDKHFK